MAKEMLPGTPAIWADYNPLKVPPAAGAKFYNSLEKPKTTQEKEKTGHSQEENSGLQWPPHIGNSLDVIA